MGRRFAYANPALYHPEGDTQEIYARLATPLKAAFLRSFLTPWPLTADDWTRLLLSHAGTPLHDGPTPDPDPAAWKAPPKAPPALTAAGNPAAWRRPPSRLLPPVVPAKTSRVAVVAGALVAPLLLASTLFVGSAPSTSVARTDLAWHTTVKRPVDKASERVVTLMLSQLPSSMAAVEHVLAERGNGR